MFSLSSFIKTGLMGAVGHLADYQIILNSAGWLEKGVLTEADLSDIQEAINAQYAAQPEIVEEPDVTEEG